MLRSLSITTTFQVDNTMESTLTNVTEIEEIRESVRVNDNIARTRRTRSSCNDADNNPTNRSSGRRQTVTRKGSTNQLPVHSIVILKTEPVLTASEYAIIDTLITTKLPSLSLRVLKSLSYLQSLLRKTFDKQYRKDLAQVNRLIQLRRILYACVVRQVIITEKRPLPTQEDLEVMPFYSDPDLIPTTSEEAESLRRYLQATQVLHEIGLAGSGNKQTYVETAALFDGLGQSYALGGAPSKATIRRVIIFHIVTGVTQPPRILGKRRRGSPLASSSKSEDCEEVSTTIGLDDENDFDELSLFEHEEYY